MRLKNEMHVQNKHLISDKFGFYWCYLLSHKTFYYLHTIDSYIYQFAKSLGLHSEHCNAPNWFM